MKAKKFWQFKAKKDDPSVGELMLYGEISSYSWWGDEVTPKQFKEDLDALGDISELKIYINSGGGDVFAGQAIHSMLKRHSATKTVYIDGLAASIASVIAMAGDKIIMPKNAMMMVHKCWTLAIGNADDMRKMAGDMDKIDESIIATYVEKTGLEEDDIIELMTDETWMTAQDALDYGFADEIEEQKQIAASIKDGRFFVNGLEMDFSRYQNTPRFPVNEGKTLSSANESRLVQARDLLDEVIEQAGTNASAPAKPAKARAEPEPEPDNQAVQIAKAKLMLELEL